MKVIALICPTCGNKIFSRARHDFRSCHDIFIDGGQDYTRIGFKDKIPKQVKINITQTLKELYDDWNNQIDKYGIIKCKNK